MEEFIGRLIGLDNVTSIDETEVSLGAAWVQGGLFWLVLGCVALFATAIVFYIAFQPRGRLPMRIALGVCRGLILVLLLLTLAKPILHTTVTSEQPPALYFVFDGTDSMAIEDDLKSEERQALHSAVGLPPSAETRLTRAAYVKAFLNKEENLLKQLSDGGKCRIETFIFDGNTTSHVRKLDFDTGKKDHDDLEKLSDQISSDGQVTAIGTVLNDLGQNYGVSNLAGVVLVSDFAHNSGSAPLGSQRGNQQSPAGKLGAPIFAVGVGATQARDLGVMIQTDPKMKRAERTTVVVKLRQSGLDGESVTVKVTARKLQGTFGGDAAEEIFVGEKLVTLTSAVESVELPWVPEDSGRFEFTAEVTAIDGEIDTGNNRATREVNIIDDYLRLMYVAHQPDWEWRFVKEVFHRDKLIGMDGFRTFLASSDPRVRESNVLFLPTLTPKRSEFFKNDVIFLGDMPQTGLSDRYCDMVKEFVGKFGGGLVVIAGPRFGPQQLHGTPLADMLPVILDPQAQLRDDREYELQLTARASGYSFMNLGQNDVDNTKAWKNLGPLQWYQPVANKHGLAEVLAEHPRDTCHDGQTKQPLIAVRRFGKGEVVYVGFNEMWRLRRRYGEEYYRQFWSQLIYRLGMSHALGNEKRFVVRTDRQKYLVEEKATLTIEAYDENFEPLDEESLDDRTLQAELVIPGTGGAAEQVRPITISQLRRGVFETRLPNFSVGEYSVRVKDPVTGEFSEVRYDVSGASAERRSGVRNIRLQEDLAAQTNGRSYDLTTVSGLVNDLDLRPTVKVEPRNYPLWSTWLWFIPIVGLMLSEWLVRKLINLK